MSVPVPRSGPFATTPRMTVADYHRMIDADQFDTEEKERHELLDGWLVPKARQSPRHCSVKGVIGDWAYERELPAGWMYSQVVSVVTADSHPEPDGSFLRTAWWDEPCRYPRADEVAIVIEAADGSLAVDRTVKAGIYARAGVPVYWLVNLVDLQVEVHLEPTDGRYRCVGIVRPGQVLPVRVGGEPVGELPVANLFPS